ncbi:transcription factor bHLH68-like isoform X3 [Salvia splendens]|uniref:transcription factor bHLH68-like isoform X3 n=1 Tax=Salvia splendens TaxID=180675 RepID=UPI001C25C049|nr:transcription factor bHLH68-like isoform X3 [Salvia splendens]
MMAGNPNWWSMHPQLIYGVSNSTNPSPSDLYHPSLDFPVMSWSQLLLSGEDERFQQQKKIEKWELEEEDNQVLNLNQSFTRNNIDIGDVKPHIYGHDQDQFLTTVLNFSGASSAAAESKNQQHNKEHSSEKSKGGVSKKARVQESAQPALKVRKEKLGDRITALHQLVSPFGKTDTASVLSEAIGYIRFLQSQIEALSSPYMGNAGHHQHSVQERNCLFPEEHSQDSQGQSDLRGRGLCLVPISCTQHVGNENGVDYWAPTAFGGGF